jgi:hypothetical protein
VDKKPKNQSFSKSTNIYMRPADHDWLQAHAAHLSGTSSRRVTVAEIIREAVMQYRKQHENEVAEAE